MNASIYVLARPWNIKFFSDVVTQAFPHQKIIFLSDFRGVGDVWLGEILYKSFHVPSMFSEEETSDIYLRCRFLRSIKYVDAHLLIRKMAWFISRILSDKKVVFVVSHLIDNFTADILERVCRKKGISYTTVCPHFFSGYSRFTRRGELVKIRENVSDQEIAEVLKKVILKSYRPDYSLKILKNRTDVLRLYCRETIKQSIYFPLMKVIKREKMNYHYNTVFFDEMRSFKNAFVKHESFFTHNPPKKDLPIVYMPLHFTPEATVDYWCEDSHCVFYEKSVLQVIDQSCNNFSFFVKEHPAMYYIRNASFYRALSKRPNVHLIHPYANSNEVLNNCAIVYVYTGSVGVEALLRNKLVFSRTKNYYSDLHPNIRYKNFLTDVDIFSDKENYPTEKFLENLLKGLFPAVFKVGKNNIRESNTETIATYLRQYFDAEKKKTNY